ncbi:ComEC/Rec2 family competence protein [Pontiellaceae bacterium B12227]|nr:ComEC/Rec2 family competence protein [Pontiellaceae bacterium B12227]
MIGIAIAIVMGMLLASGRLISPSWLFISSVLSVLSSLILLNRPASSVLVYVSIALTAACRFEVVWPSIRPDSIDHVDTIQGQQVECIGQVNVFPEFHGYKSDISGIWFFSCSVDALRISNGWNSASGKIDLRIFGNSDDIPVGYGDKVNLRGVIKKNIFPSENRCQMLLKESDLQILEHAGGWSVVQWGHLWRNSVAVRLEPGIENLPVHEAVLKALVLGYRKEMPAQIMNIFRRTGSLHIFAISGLHVGIVGFLLILLLKMLGVPRDKFGLLLVPLLSFYVISTGMKSSALRALLMAAIFILGPLFRRKPDIPSSVAIAAIILLIFQPLEILSVGFIFSFTVVIFLVMGFATIPKAWVKGAWLKVYIISLIITSVVAGLASAPLTMLYFGMFSPVALIGNLVVVPLTFFIVLCGWVSIIFPMLSCTFNQAAVIFIDLMLGTVSWLDGLPGGSFMVDPPPLVSIVLWYTSLIAFLIDGPGFRHRRIAAAGAVVAILLAMIGRSFFPLL